MRTGEIGMLSQKELDTKTNEELLILYKQTNDQTNWFMRLQWIIQKFAFLLPQGS